MNFARVTYFIALTWCSINLTTAMPPSCPIGSFRNGKSCSLCAPGTYQHEAGATSCLPCPTGYYNPFRGAHGPDRCSECPEGTFNNRTASTSIADCKPCPSGTNSPRGSATCISCPRGQYISLCGGDRTAAYGFCVLFDPFYLIAQGPQKIQCKPCRRNAVAEEPNSVRCKFDPCLPPLGPIDGICSTCPMGKGIELFSKGCKPCADFKINDGTSARCTKCPAGYIGNKKSRATRCIPCRKRTFKGAGDTTCRKCPSGQNSFVTGASICRTDKTACASNFFRSNTGTCESCTRAQRYNPVKNVCIDCKESQESLGGKSTKCLRCSRGFTRMKNEPRCVCDAGWELISGEKCRKCKRGYYKGDRGNHFCRKCYLGNIAPKTGMKECIDCPEGTTTLLKGQTRCKPANCREGLIFSAGEFTCIDPGTGCPPKFNRIIGPSVLDGFNYYCSPNDCPPDQLPETIDPELGGTVCRACNDDERLVPPRNSNFSADCVRCEDDEIGEGTICRKCPNGEIRVNGKCTCTRGRHIVRNKCVSCPAGTFGPFHVSGKCKPCPPGTFSEKLSTSCKVCPAGSFSLEGSPSCEMCPPRTTTFGVGEENCVRVGKL